MNSQRKLSFGVTFIFLVLSVKTAWSQEEFGFEGNTDLPSSDFYNFIEIGVGATENANGKFGEFTQPLQSDGLFGVMAVQLSGIGNDNLHRWFLNSSTELHPELNAGLSEQGSYRMNFSYWQSVKVEMDNTLTPFAGPTRSNLQLPSGYINPDSSSGSNSSADPAFYGEKDFAVKRDTFEFGGTRYFGDHWALSVDLSSQEKEGEKATGGGQGFAGSTLLIEPVDYQHDEMTVTLEYTDKRWQWSLAGYYSEFDNENGQVSFDNPLTDEKHLVGLQQLDLYPDNEFLRISFDSGLSINDFTRLSFFADWNQAKQDDDFLPYSVGNPDYYSSFSGSPFSPLPATSLDGEVERLNARIVLSSRPTRRFNYKVEFSYKDKDSKHNAFPADYILYSGSVSKASGTTHVFDKDSELISIEGGYRFANRSRLRLGWDHEVMDRETEEVTGKFTDETEENLYWTEYHLPLLGRANIKFRVEYSQLDTDLSEERESHLHSAEPEATPEAAIPTFLTEYDRMLYKLRVDYPFTETLMASGSLDIIRDNFDNDFFGIDERDSQVLSLDLSWALSLELSITGYVIFEQVEWEQTGQQSEGNGTVVGRWQIDSDNNSESYGVLVNWQAIEDTLDLEFSTSYLDSDSSQSGKWLLNEFEPEAMPNSGTNVHRIEASANWHLNDQMDIRGRYIYERYRCDDWAWDSRNFSTIAFGWEEPNYDAHVLTLSLHYRF
ncbi:MAG: MtrB/PioB family decaheme-associated outer membrane protein [Pseudomonadales bacterium]|nr:MtrB/PioB family decaheme-associated outer membrane protein [Pseudomonadales bacterium]